MHTLLLVRASIENEFRNLDLDDWSIDLERLTAKHISVVVVLRSIVGGDNLLDLAVKN